MFARISAVVLCAFVLLLAGPFEWPNPADLNLQLSLSLLSLAVSGLVIAANLDKRTWATPFDVFLLAYVSVVAVTAVTSIDRLQTLRASLTLGAEILLFYATAIVARNVPGLGRAVLTIIVVAAALVQIMALSYHVEIGFRLRPGAYPVPIGWSGYPELSALLVVQVGILIAAVATAGRPLSRAMAIGLAGIAGIETLFLYSRTAWVACLLMGFGTTVMADARRWRQTLVRTAAVVLVLAGVAATIPTVRAMALSLLGISSAVRAVPGTTTPASRLSIWGKTIDMIADAPLVGVGLGNFRSIYETEYHPELANDLRRGAHAHNLWLHQAAEIGIVGALCLAALWIRVLMTAWKTARRDRNFVAVGVWLALLGGAASNLIDGVPYQSLGIRVYMLHWILFGLVAGSSQAVVPDLEAGKRDHVD